MNVDFVIQQIKEASEILKKSNEEWEEKMLERFIEQENELIYSKYCESYPERIHSDFEFEDIDDVHEYVRECMYDDFQVWLKQQ